MAKRSRGRRKIHSDRQKSIYKTYRKRYFAKKRQFAKLNRKNIREGKPQRYEMREGIMDIDDFFTNYPKYQRKLEEEGIKNPNVTQYIVSDQAYSKSRKQFRGLKKALSEGEITEGQLGLDKDFNELNFRTGQIGINWDIILNDYHELREAFGYSSQEAAALIANLYFGSE